MTRTTLTTENISEFLNNLPFTEFKSLVKNYTKHTKTNLETEMKRLVTLNLQKRLERLGINSSCPTCGSEKIEKYGKRSTGVQVYRCKGCNRIFSLFTGTILEKTSWHWDIWIKVLNLTLNGYSIEDMVNILKKDYGCEGINPKTVWLWRAKLIHAIATFSMPTLSGVIQVDETFIRESQKGSRTLVSPLKGIERKPRYGSHPSKFGTMGPEFATVTTAIDNRGYCVCKVSGMGRLTTEQFVDYFDSYFDNPSYICSDANPIYEEYCELFKIPHYIKPSSYEEILKTNGYIKHENIEPSKIKETTANNKKILVELYKRCLIERITGKGTLSHAEFCKLKEANGLNLGRVNELHKDLKAFINKDMTNVSTKYLQDYVGYFTFLKNWTAQYGTKPTSMQDAKIILEEILKLKINYTTFEVENQTLEVPKPTGKYVSVLKAETQKARIATENKYFKFDEEDGMKTFNKRDYLSNIPRYKLYEICKECGLKGYKKLALWSIISALLKQPNINGIIYRLLERDRHYKIADEDLEHIKAGHFIMKAKTPMD